MPTDEQQDLRDFHARLGSQLENGGVRWTLDEALSQFRANQAELDRCREEIRPALEASLRGELEPLDRQGVIDRVSAPACARVHRLMAIVSKSSQADADLEAIGDDIGEQSGSPAIAARFLKQRENVMESYARQPLMGELREDWGESIRSFSFKRNYVVIYQPLDDGIGVLRDFHATRDYPRLFHSGG